MRAGIRSTHLCYHTKIIGYLPVGIGTKAKLGPEEFRTWLAGQGIGARTRRPLFRRFVRKLGAGRGHWRPHTEPSRFERSSKSKLHSSHSSATLYTYNSTSSHHIEANQLHTECVSATSSANFIDTLSVSCRHLLPSPLGPLPSPFSTPNTATSPAQPPSASPFSSWAPSKTCSVTSSGRRRSSTAQAQVSASKG